MGAGRRGVLFRVAAAAAATLGVALADARLPDEPRDGQREAFVPDPAVANLLSFGFEAVVGDLQWLRAIQIVGGEDGASGRSPLIAALLDVVTTLDPWVDHPYRFAAVWLTDDEAAVRRANLLLRRGIAHHPDDWRGYFYLAFNHLYYLGEQAEAARALEPALTLEGAPPYLGRLLARLKSGGGGLEASATFLQEMAARAPDDSERAAYERALGEIETERRARFLDAARAEFVRRHKRDIARVEDLVVGGVLRQLPPEPFGASWELDARTGQIVSSKVRYRYGVKIDATNQALLARFRDRSRPAQTK